MDGVLTTQAKSTSCGQAANASRLRRTCWHHLPLTVDAKLAVSLSTENAANVVSSVLLPAAAGTATTSQLQRDVSNSHAKLATDKAQLLHTASAADDDNSDIHYPVIFARQRRLQVPRHRGEHLREADSDEK